MSNRRAANLGLLVFALLCGSAAAEAACLSYDAPVSNIVGKLEKRTFFGPPGYGENPKTDRRETQAVLVLESRVCANRGVGSEGEAESDQREITLVAGDGVVFGANFGKRIAVSGELFHAFTGHHHTKLLVRVSRAAVLQP